MTCLPTTNTPMTTTPMTTTPMTTTPMTTQSGGNRKKFFFIQMVLQTGKKCLKQKNLHMVSDAHFTKYTDSFQTKKSIC